MSYIALCKPERRRTCTACRWRGGARTTSADRYTNACGLAMLGERVASGSKLQKDRPVRDRYPALARPARRVGCAELTEGAAGVILTAMDDITPRI